MEKVTQKFWQVCEQGHIHPWPNDRKCPDCMGRFFAGPHIDAMGQALAVATKRAEIAEAKFALAVVCNEGKEVAVELFHATQIENEQLQEEMKLLKLKYEELLKRSGADDALLTVWAHNHKND